MFTLFSILFIAAAIGVISLILWYNELNRLGLILAVTPVVLAILIFVSWGVTGGGFRNLSEHYQTPEGSKTLLFWFSIISLVTLLTLFREGTIFWLWRRIHPSSAPTAALRASQRGNGIRQNSGKTASTLMGTSTSMFKNSELDIRTIALVRLAFVSFTRTDRKTIIGIESFLRLGDGRKYRSYQQLVAEILDSKTTMKDIVHPYWRAINGNVATARIMFADLCRLASVTGNLDKRTINNLIKAGSELGLSQEEMQRAL